MKYYAYVTQHGEGCDYTIGCGNTLVSIEADSDEDARIKLSEVIEEEYTDERELGSVLLFKGEIGFDLSETYSDLQSKNDEKELKDNLIKDMEEFQRLKDKLGK